MAGWDEEEVEDEELDDELEVGDTEGPRGLAWAALLVAPLLAAYELSLGGSGEDRAIAERLATHLFRLAGDHQASLRWGLVALAFGWGAWRTAGAEFERGRTALKTLLESAVLALVLGPLLLALLRWFPVDPAEFRLERSGARPSLAGVGHVLGCAAWEELLLRLGLFSLVYLLASRLVKFLGGPRPVAELTADVAALLASSLAFAAVHLHEVAVWVGSTGEVFDRHVFLWRTLAGLALGALYRWRGLAVATWTHAFYNLGFALGASPAVFLVD